MIKIRTAALLLAAALCLSSCAAQPAAEEQTSSAAAETAAPETTSSTFSPVVSRAEADRMIVETSLISTGNTERMENALKKAGNGEALTVAYIGGSITEGIAVDREKCWARLSCDYLEELYPESDITYINAGMSGTPSTLGTIRCERDVLANGDPDIVYIEFAVNDAQDTNSKEGYESLVRRMLALPSHPAVVLVFMRTSIGYSCEKHMSEIGYYYGLPMISVTEALTTAFGAGVLTWDKYSDDEAHPNEKGNRYVADMINYFVDCVRDGTEVRSGRESEAAAGEVGDIKPIYGDAYVNMHLLDRTNLTPVSIGEYDGEKPTISQFPNGWTRKGGENEGFVCDIECKSLYIVYQCVKSKKGGTADIYVDGEKKIQVRSYSDDGWNNPVEKLVIKSDELKTRRVEVKMAEGFEDCFFGILGFGYTD